MTPLQTLTKRIQAHCPELTKVSFGCEIKLNDDIGQFVSNFAGGYDIMFSRLAIPQVISHKHTEKLEILGHPIQLHHALRAIGDMLYLIDCHGNMYRTSMKLNDKRPKLERCVCTWKMGKDLSSQSPETIEWLLTVIK